MRLVPRFGSGQTIRQPKPLRRRSRRRRRGRHAGLSRQVIHAGCRPQACTDALKILSSEDLGAHLAKRILNLPRILLVDKYPNGDGTRVER